MRATLSGRSLFVLGAQSSGMLFVLRGHLPDRRVVLDRFVPGSPPRA